MLDISIKFEKSSLDLLLTEHYRINSIKQATKPNVDDRNAEMIDDLIRTTKTETYTLENSTKFYVIIPSVIISTIQLIHE